MQGLSIPQLGGFEDLYYASVAKLKNLSSNVEILLTNGFMVEADMYFSYKNNPLSSLGLVTLGSFKEFLKTQEAILRDESLTALLQKGIVRKGMQSKLRRAGGQQQTSHGLGWLMNVQGLQDVFSMNSAIILGNLAEKHHFAVNKAKLQPHKAAQDSQAYVANQHVAKEDTADIMGLANLKLDENHFDLTDLAQLKIDDKATDDKTTKLEKTAQFPCICDPDCICYGVCASDPTQDCLCEENPLFVQITEGANIDDLDVPDLVRDETHDSDIESDADTMSVTSSISPSYSQASTDEHEPDEDEDQILLTDEQGKNVNETSSRSMGDHIWTTSEGFILKKERKFTNDEMNELIMNNGYYNNIRGIPPPGMSKFTFLKALKEPYLEECAHPPRRMSTRPSVISYFGGSRKSFRASKSRCEGDHASLKATGARVAKPERKRGTGLLSLSNLKKLRSII